ncbi:MAG: hypothetical protein LQ340_003792 [Diploschistes diacapsis]|nr:MAG: hypothetical protein LQ340_003792 [Diploschistes diacapsis]
MPVHRTKKGRWDSESCSAAQQKRGPWSTAEDESLRDLVREKGAGKWVQISDVLKTRSPKQCRERWHQNLKPELNHEPISEEEGRRIEEMVKVMGKKWAEIARNMENRSDNAVKNWWNGGENRRKREQARANEGAHAHIYGDPYRAALANPSYRSHNADAMLFDRQILPPLRGIDRGTLPPPLHIPEPRHYVDPAEPSPLTGATPSLISDTGTEPSLQNGYYSRHSSFTMSHPRFTHSSVDMHRTPSNESYGYSPKQCHYNNVSHRGSRGGGGDNSPVVCPQISPVLRSEISPRVRPEMIQQVRRRPSITDLAETALQDAACSSVVQHQRFASNSNAFPASPNAMSPPRPRPSPPRETSFRHTSSGPEESKAKMSVHNILG